MSNSTTWEKKLKLRRGDPIEACGLKFYPVKMLYYDEFLDCKPAWIVRTSTLAAKYFIMPYLSALWAIEYDLLQEQGKITGLFERLLRLLYLSLRLEYDRERALRMVEIDRTDPRKIHHITVVQDGNAVQITPPMFASYIRPLVAEMNGFELPDESHNPDLIRTEKEIAEENAGKFKYSTDTLIASVAYLSGICENDLYDWTIAQFDRRVHAIERDKEYTFYRQAQYSGLVKFPKGTVAPSWCYDKEHRTTALSTKKEAIDTNTITNKKEKQNGI